MKKGLIRMEVDRNETGAAARPAARPDGAPGRRGARAEGRA
ncbi:hypothetical protein BTRA_4923 [Burkholderia thailandensis USAMRU Malaysia |uniref:Uncharacterized protein n=1 Tax=Burkholderia thailandensis TaxID=57975 RepID=A0AAW9CSR5_BURTH|nr:hypothetical protein BTL_4998 [Burkholderia thailandensis H0587]AHI75880.1 hypothetical protein BTQ_5532 [Burkholderia thailandensis 2002721723]AHI81295.1 hypothetical protein BTJ_4188 [Burkholderia thailandensis E444]AIC89741.1 hypothetical protein BTRA_4923 [Burkholderia thailandensis USAMRU Malaysia \